MKVQYFSSVHNTHPTELEFKDEKELFEFLKKQDLWVIGFTPMDWYDIGKNADLFIQVYDDYRE